MCLLRRCDRRELAKNISVTINIVLFTPSAKNFAPPVQRREKISRNRVQEKETQRERTVRNQNKHLLYILDDKFLNVDTTLHRVLYQRSNRDNISHQLQIFPKILHKLPSHALTS